MIQKYNKNAEVLFVSEESYNFGAFTYIRPRVNIVLAEQGFKPIE